MRSKRLAIVLLLAAGVAATAFSQTLALAPEVTMELNWRVLSEPGYLLVDPNPELSLSNRVRLGAVLGLGFFTFQSTIDFLYDLGVEFSMDRFGSAAEYVNTPLQQPYVERDQTLGRGLVGVLRYSVADDITLKTRWFVGLVQTTNFQESGGYSGTLEARSLAVFSYLDKQDYDLAVSLSGLPSSGAQRYAVVFSAPLSLSDGDIQISPLVGYLQPGVPTNSYLDDLVFDFSSFSIGPGTSQTTGNSIADISGSLKIRPFRDLGVFLINSLYLGPTVDAALLWDRTTPFSRPKSAAMVGAAAGLQFFGVNFELRLGYRSDVSGFFVVSFRIYEQQGHS